VVVAGAGIAAMVLGSALPETPRHVIVAAGLTLAISAGVILGLLSVRLRTAIRREEEAGYTTLFDRGHQAYWLLDPATGAVVRKPGESRSGNQS
jgi:hypothetical protein